MENLTGMKWYQLTDVQREELLSIAVAVDGVTGNAARKSGECIIDFEGTSLAVSGTVEKGNDEDVITIDDKSIIYNSEDGVITD